MGCMPQGRLVERYQPGRRRSYDGGRRNAVSPDQTNGEPAGAGRMGRGPPVVASVGRGGCPFRFYKAVWSIEYRGQLDRDFPEWPHWDTTILHPLLKPWLSFGDSSIGGHRQMSSARRQVAHQLSGMRRGFWRSGAAKCAGICMCPLPNSDLARRERSSSHHARKGTSPRCLWTRRGLDGRHVCADHSRPGAHRV